MCVLLRLCTCTCNSTCVPPPLLQPPLLLLFVCVVCCVGSVWLRLLGVQHIAAGAAAVVCVGGGVA